MVRVFANGQGDLGSIPGRVIPKIEEMVLDASLLNTQHYKVQSKGKLSNTGKGVYICRCLPPDKVNNPKADYSGDFGEGKVRILLVCAAHWTCNQSTNLFTSMRNTILWYIIPQ